ncbi:MAG: DEAD/DEAH box helicase family protein [Bdellovibrionota bacterium]
MAFLSLDYASAQETKEIQTAISQFRLEQTSSYQWTPFQQEVFFAFQKEILNNTTGYIKMPTQTGKTLIISRILSAVVQQSKAKGKPVPQILITTPFATGVVDLYDKISKYHPELHPYLGRVTKNFSEYDAPIRITTNLSFLLHTRDGRLDPKNYSLVINDECHLLLGEHISQELKKYLSGSVVIGFTATPNYNKELSRQAKSLYKNVFYDKVDFREAIARGILAPHDTYVLPYIETESTNPENAKTKIRDLENHRIDPQRIVETYEKFYDHRQGTPTPFISPEGSGIAERERVFIPVIDKAHGKAIEDAFNQKYGDGFAALIVENTSIANRFNALENINDTEQGKNINKNQLRVIISPLVFSVGVSMPWVTGVIFARFLGSHLLLEQILGRSAAYDIDETGKILNPNKRVTAIQFLYTNSLRAQQALVTQLLKGFSLESPSHFSISVKQYLLKMREFIDITWLTKEDFVAYNMKWNEITASSNASSEISNLEELRELLKTWHEILEKVQASPLNKRRTTMMEELDRWYGDGFYENLIEPSMIRAYADKGIKHTDGEIIYSRDALRTLHVGTQNNYVFLSNVFRGNVFSNWPDITSVRSWFMDETKKVFSTHAPSRAQVDSIRSKFFLSIYSEKIYGPLPPKNIREVQSELQKWNKKIETARSKDLSNRNTYFHISINTTYGKDYYEEVFEPKIKENFPEHIVDGKIVYSDELLSKLEVYRQETYIKNLRYFATADGGNWTPREILFEWLATEYKNELKNKTIDPTMTLTSYKLRYFSECSATKQFVTGSINLFDMKKEVSFWNRTIEEVLSRDKPQRWNLFKALINDHFGDHFFESVLEVNLRSSDYFKPYLEGENAIQEDALFEKLFIESITKYTRIYELLFVQNSGSRWTSSGTIITYCRNQNVSLQDFFAHTHNRETAQTLEQKIAFVTEDLLFITRIDGLQKEAEKNDIISTKQTYQLILQDYVGLYSIKIGAISRWDAYQKAYELYGKQLFWPTPDELKQHFAKKGFKTLNDFLKDNGIQRSSKKSGDRLSMGVDPSMIEIHVLLENIVGKDRFQLMTTHVQELVASGVDQLQALRFVMMESLTKQEFSTFRSQFEQINQKIIKEYRKFLVNLILTKTKLASLSGTAQLGKTALGQVEFLAALIVMEATKIMMQQEIPSAQAYEMARQKIFSPEHLKSLGVFLGTSVATQSLLNSSVYAYLAQVNSEEWRSIFVEFSTFVGRVLGAFSMGMGLVAQSTYNSWTWIDNMEHRLLQRKCLHQEYEQAHHALSETIGSDITPGMIDPSWMPSVNKDEQECQTNRHFFSSSAESGWKIKNSMQLSETTVEKLQDALSLIDPVDVMVSFGILFVSSTISSALLPVGLNTLLMLSMSSVLEYQYQKLVYGLETQDKIKRRLKYWTTRFENLQYLPHNVALKEAMDIEKGWRRNQPIVSQEWLQQFYEEFIHEEELLLLQFDLESANLLSQHQAAMLRIMYHIENYVFWAHLQENDDEVIYKAWEKKRLLEAGEESDIDFDLSLLSHRTFPRLSGAINVNPLMNMDVTVRMFRQDGKAFLEELHKVVTTPIEQMKCSANAMEGDLFWKIRDVREQLQIFLCSGQALAQMNELAFEHLHKPVPSQSLHMLLERDMRILEQKKPSTNPHAAAQWAGWFLWQDRTDWISSHVATEFFLNQQSLDFFGQTPQDLIKIFGVETLQPYQFDIEEDENDLSFIGSTLAPSAIKSEKNIEENEPKFVQTHGLSSSPPAKQMRTLHDSSVACEYQIPLNAEQVVCSMYLYDPQTQEMDPEPIFEGESTIRNGEYKIQVLGPTRQAANGRHLIIRVSFFAQDALIETKEDLVYIPPQNTKPSQKPYRSRTTGRWVYPN